MGVSYYIRVIHHFGYFNKVMVHKNTEANRVKLLFLPDRVQSIKYVVLRYPTKIMHLFVREVGVTPKCSICSNEILMTTEFTSAPESIQVILGQSLSLSMTFQLDIHTTKYIRMYTYAAAGCSSRWICLFDSMI